MPQARGFFEKLLMVFESTYNTTPSISPGDMVLVPFNRNNNLGSDENMIDAETIIPGKRYETEPIFGNISVAGGFTVPMDVRYIGYWLKLLLGAPVTSGAGPYTHTFEPSSDSPSVTLESGFTDISRFHVFNGIKVNRFSATFEVDTELTAEIDLLGGKELASSGTTLDASPVEQTITRFNAKNVTLKEAGSPLAICKSVTVNIDQGLADDVFTLNSGGFRYSLPEGKMMISGTANLLFLDSTYPDKAIAGTETSLEIECTQGAHTLTITLPEVKFKRKPITRDGWGPMYFEMEWKAYYQNNAAGVPITVELVNDVTDYA